MKKIIVFIIILFTAGLIGLTINKQSQKTVTNETTFWDFRAIDTMKYSRDPSREKLNDPSYDKVIDKQIRQIAETGATHVGIATPYDEEFLPILKRWVAAARKYDLKIWFRGNWSGWERWFGYEGISREEHIEKTKEFIVKHPELFENGDVFSACPECENGGPGDPRMNRDAEGHKKFLIDEYKVTQEAFKAIGKNVRSNFNSMNGDVARLIMDRETTQALGGIVVVDHYVRTPEQLAADIQEYAKQSGGQVILGEFGAPIPDIHGDMTEEEQALWIKNALKLLLQEKSFVGISYWTNYGGSTELWNPDGTPRKAVEELTKVYNPTLITLIVQNDLGDNLNARITYDGKTVTTNGDFTLPYLIDYYDVTIEAEGYQSQTVTITGDNETIILKKDHENIFYQFRKFLKYLF
ncbi:MAG TPA: hypothetical protein VLF20_03030 [Patescibacteria group bacterium]|nr:hypothetical protein [Patescibacteria group bacterium]